MKNWKQATLNPNATIREALEVIEQAGIQIALVVDKKYQLVGVITDGDIRRGFLSGLRTSDKITSIVNYNPKTAKASASRKSIVASMRLDGLRQVPIVDENGAVVDIETANDYIEILPKKNWVVIMAGGLGSRLGALTKNTPKPLLAVGPRPLLETIIISFIEHGFSNFYIAVNYKAEKIVNYFGNGEKFNVNIRYLREEQRLGTAGALSLLPELPKQPIFVTNSDVLHNANLDEMLKSHCKTNADATMGIKKQEFQIPFGVVENSNGKILSIDEKPKKIFNISAGIYVLAPKVLELVPENTFFDMPTLFDKLIKSKMLTNAYQIDGYWLDIGHRADYEKANREFGDNF